MKFHKLDRNSQTKLQAMILGDPDLSQWFFELCIGQKPSIEVLEDKIRLLEKHDIIRRTETGFELGESGKEFGLVLGLIQEEGPL